MSDTELEQAYKAAMRRLAATIALITSGTGDDWSGMAATAVVSICADPPTLLVAVNRSASFHATLHAEKRFCVNVLSQRHQDLVAAFSGKKKGLARFDHGGWVAGPHGLPVLPDALSSMACSTKQTLDVGTHTLFIGAVEQVINHETIDPLVWVDGSFATAQR